MRSDSVFHPYPSRMTSGTKPDAESSDAQDVGKLRDVRALTAELADELATELGRVADLFRRMPHSKFTLRLEPYGDRARAGHWLTGQLAGLAQGAEEWQSATPPRWRTVPSLGVFALGDQIAVTGADLLAAFLALPDPDTAQIWARGDGRVPAEKALAAVLESTTALRKRL